MKISYSGLSEYKGCGEKFRLNRVEKIRPVNYSSAFFFGSAVDDATEAYLLDTACPYETFKKGMLTAEYNREVIDLPKNEFINYYATDFDESLMEDVDWKKIEDFAKELSVGIPRPSNARERKALKGNERRVFNYMNWLSLMRKGPLLIEHFCNWADEHIEETIACQREIKLENAEGDILRGYLDVLARFKDGITRVIDIKTASDPKKQYPEGCVETSPQLIIYAEAQGMSEAGYFVLDKRIRKREPRVRSRFLVGKIQQEKADEIFNGLETDLTNIKLGNFEHNWDACNDYGGCPYFKYCRNGDATGLVQLEKEDGK